MVSNNDYREYLRNDTSTTWFVGGSMPPPKETKKEKQHRLATEKMYASWSTFNEKERNVKNYVSINVKQSYKSFNRRKH